MTRATGGRWKPSKHKSEADNQKKNTHIWNKLNYYELKELLAFLKHWCNTEHILHCNKQENISS